ncbi:MAG: MFS transporter [Candidatus Acidiferrales bacterium]
MRAMETNSEPKPMIMDDATGRWRALALLAFAAFLEMTTWFSASSVLPQLRAAWGVSASAGAWLTISVQLGFVAGALVSAVLNLADIFPPRRLMLYGGAGAAAVNLALLASHGLANAVPLRFATGAALALVYPPATKLIATWFRRERGMAIGVMVGGLTLGSAMPHLLNGLGGAHWTTVIVATSALTLAGGLLAAFVAHDGPFPFPRAVFNPREGLRLFANRGVRLATLGYFGHMWELYAMWTWCAVFFGDAMIRARGTPSTPAERASLTSNAALAAFACIGVGAIGCWAAGVLADRWGRTRTAAASMVVSGACSLVIGFVALKSLELTIVIGLIWGFTVVADSAQFSTMITEVADQSYVGTAVTLQLAIGFTLTVATIWLVPVLRESHGWPWALAALAPGPALGVIAMLRLMRSPDAAKIAHGRG